MIIACVDCAGLSMELSRGHLRLMVKDSLLTRQFTFIYTLCFRLTDLCKRVEKCYRHVSFTVEGYK